MSIAPKNLAILVGGGPAPGINSVIGAATIRAAVEGVVWSVKGENYDRKKCASMDRSQ